MFNLFKKKERYTVQVDLSNPTQPTRVKFPKKPRGLTKEGEGVYVLEDGCNEQEALEYIRDEAIAQVIRELQDAERNRRRNSKNTR